MLVVRRVVGASMEPNLRANDVVFAHKTKHIKPGDVVIAIYKNREIIKRIAKISGGLCHVYGDNKHASTDSRSFGPIPINNVQAVVFFVAKLSFMNRKNKPQ